MPPSMFEGPKLKITTRWLVIFLLSVTGVYGTSSENTVISSPVEGGGGNGSCVSTSQSNPLLPLDSNNGKGTNDVIQTIAQDDLRKGANGTSTVDDDDYDYTRIIAHRVEGGHASEVNTSIIETKRMTCEDENPNCEFWAASGECKVNPMYMHQSCQKSCGKCPNDPDSQGTSIDILLAEDMGVTQLLTNLDHYVVEESSAKRIVETREYMLSGLRDNPQLYSGCTNQYFECISWAVAGECVKNAAFMKAACAPACMSCEDGILLPLPKSSGCLNNFVGKNGSRRGVAEQSCV